MMPEEDGLAVPRRLNRPNRPAIIMLSALGSDTDHLATVLERVAKANGFSLHAGVSCETHQKEKMRAGKARETALGHKLERLCSELHAKRGMSLTQVFRVENQHLKAHHTSIAILRRS